ncbi:pentapeptide repeat-containing protein [Nocardiopsis ganjiahuensis]|uniref:pentapeptide repeat-containing protein n=1 Tax=Nocardiopsis ganjiahuensis TaxID=239984 RepID=UPI000349982E|nr:pentapeptide repeat-containing protein [Nocardiopsis ganjiahuensis]
MRSPTPRQWTGIALTAVVLFALTLTSWPLLTLLWGLLPEDLPMRRILTGAGLAALLVVVLLRTHTEPGRPNEARLWLLISLAWAVAIGAVALMAFLVWFILGTPGLDLPDELSPRALDAIATRAFAVVAGLGGVALLVIHYRRQRTTEADAVRAEAANVRAERASEREVTKLFNERFTTAYSELGSEHGAVRLGAVHALAHLADDAPSEEEVQMVIHVLCAYLRMPYTPAPGALPEDADEAQREGHRERELEFASSREVRHTIIRIIGNHLRRHTRWRGKDYDFTGTVFDGGDLSGAVFDGGTVSFRGAAFAEGTVSFQEAVFSGGRVDFSGARFSGGEVTFYRAGFSGGEVAFHGAEFSAGRVVFNRAEFSDGSVDFDRAGFSGGRVTFEDAEFAGGRMDFGHARFAGGAVYFSGARFSGGRVNLGTAEFSDGEVSFYMADFSGGALSFFMAKFTGGEVSFFKAEISGGRVDFGNAKFSGGWMGFRQVQISGGMVDFYMVGFSGGEVDFDGSSGVCPRYLLERAERAEPGVVLRLPRQWRQATNGSGHQGGPSASAGMAGH